MSKKSKKKKENKIEYIELDNVDHLHTASNLLDENDNSLVPRLRGILNPTIGGDPRLGNVYLIDGYVCRGQIVLAVLINTEDGSISHEDSKNIVVVPDGIDLFADVEE